MHSVDTYDSILNNFNMIRVHLMYNVKSTNWIIFHSSPIIDLSNKKSHVDQGHKDQFYKKNMQMNKGWLVRSGQKSSLTYWNWQKKVLHAKIVL